VKSFFEFLAVYGHGLVFLWVLVEQLGLPVPSAPLLLAAGALAGSGKLSLPAVIVLATAAAMASNLAWYALGRSRGPGILGLLCRFSLEPDSCVRRTQESFARQGMRSLLLAKFIPGLGTAAPPLAGVARVPLSRFLIFDGLGSLLWVGAFVSTGLLFSAQLDAIVGHMNRFGTLGAALAGTGVVGYMGFKFVQRRRFMSSLRRARIQPDELKVLLDSGGKVVIVDLRHAAEARVDPRTIPGALRMSPAEVEAQAGQIDRQVDVVLFCS
jgi:membrane protein DedA with SNARE-associated domain